MREVDERSEAGGSPHIITPPAKRYQRRLPSAPSLREQISLIFDRERYRPRETNKAPTSTDDHQKNANHY